MVKTSNTANDPDKQGSQLWRSTWLKTVDTHNTHIHTYTQHTSRAKVLWDVGDYQRRRKTGWEERKKGTWGVKRRRRRNKWASGRHKDTRMHGNGDEVGHIWKGDERGGPGSSAPSLDLSHLALSITPSFLKGVYLAEIHPVQTPKILDDWAKPITLCEPTHLPLAQLLPPSLPPPSSPSINPPLPSWLWMISTSTTNQACPKFAHAL